MFGFASSNTIKMTEDDLKKLIEENIEKGRQIANEANKTVIAKYQEIIDGQQASIANLENALKLRSITTIKEYKKAVGPRNLRFSKLSKEEQDAISNRHKELLEWNESYREDYEKYIKYEEKDKVRNLSPEQRATIGYQEYTTVMQMMYIQCKWRSNPNHTEEQEVCFNDNFNANSAKCSQNPEFNKDCELMTKAMQLIAEGKDRIHTIGGSESQDTQRINWMVGEIKAIQEAFFPKNRNSRESNHVIKKYENQLRGDAPTQSSVEKNYRTI